MANQTITTDTNHDALTGRNAGENITVNSGATLTIDSWVTKTSMGVMGDFTVNEGKVLVDARNVKRIAYSSGSGTLPAIGDIVRDVTTGAQGKVIWLTSGTATSGVITITVQSGTFTATNTIDDQPTANLWTATMDSVGVGLLVYYGEDQNYGGTGLGTYEFLGDWYELGTGDGTDNQTFTRPWSEGINWAIWVETGSGTNVFEEWVRIETGESLTAYGTGELGRVFTQTRGNATITCGTSTNGGVVPNGARVRIPNIHFGTTTTGAPETEVTTTSNGSYIDFQSNGSLTLLHDRVNFSSARPYCSGTKSINSQYVSFGFTTNPQNTVDGTWSNCVGAKDDTLYDTTTCLSVQDCTNSTFTDCTIYHGPTAPSFSDVPLAIETSNDVAFVRCRVMFGATFTVNRPSARCRTIDSCSFTDCTFLRSQLSIENGSSNITITNYKFGHRYTSSGSITSGVDGVAVSFSSNVVVDGIEVVSDAGGDDFISISDSTNVTVRNMGTRASPVDVTNCDTLINCQGSTNNSRFQRLYSSGASNNRSVQTSSASSNNEFSNVYTDFNRELDITSRDSVVRGCGMGSGGHNNSQGIEVDYTNVFGGNFFDVFTAATTGKIGVHFKVPTVTEGGYTEVSGTPIFNAAGDLLLRTVGDQVIQEFQRDILGHTALANIAPSISGSSTGNIDVDYAISDDSGATWGAWTVANATNLSGETWGADGGYRIRFRFTANATNSGTFINGYYIETTTTTAAQDANQYSIADTVPLQITCKDASDLSNIQNAQVYIEAATGGAAPYQDSVTITRSGSTATVTHTAHGMANGDKVTISGADQSEYNGIKTITNVATNSYDYTVSGTPTTPATGTIIATQVFLSALTDASGVASVDFPYVSDQPITGRARKGTTSPFYQNAIIAGTIGSAGFTNTTFMVGDE